MLCKKRNAAKLPQSTFECGEKTLQSIMIAALYNGDEKSMLKLHVSTPQSGFAADIFTAF